jgi:hypothetical protein
MGMALVKLALAEQAGGSLHKKRDNFSQQERTECCLIAK